MSVHIFKVLFLEVTEEQLVATENNVLKGTQ